MTPSDPADPVTSVPTAIGEDFQDGLPASLPPAMLLSRWLAALTRLTRARYGALGIINEDGTFNELLHTEPAESRLAHVAEFIARPEVIDAVFRRHRAIRVNGPMRVPGRDGRSPNDVPIGSSMGVPFASHGSLVGLVYLAGKELPGGFTRADELVARIAVDAIAPILDRTCLLQHLAAQREPGQGGRR